jgi:cellulose synthase/poly-beta-1,6-N-acetylglucosamine synthase-like glycosyltransferase
MSPVVIALLAVSLASSLSLLHVFLLYPGLLSVAARLASPTETRPADAELPTVSLIIAAYNEEDVIAEKIENSLELDYPAEKLDIVVFSDESDDRTDDIVRSYASDGVDLERIEGRVGKTECQNRVAAEADADVLVFSDANCMYERDAIRRLVARLTDGVGCVVGELRHTRSEDDVIGESVYWRYNRFVKRRESETGSVVKGNGAIYAVRNDDYVELPADAMSDFAEPLAVRERGRAVKYAHDAVAREGTTGSVEAELSRKTRIATRSWHTLWQHLGLLNPLRYGRYSFQLFTDTVLWWSIPILLAATFTSAVGLWLSTGSVLFALVVAGFAAFFALGLVGHLLERNGVTTPSVVHVVYYFLVSNYSLLVGGWNFLRGRNIVTWETINE